ncbi:uncharacterized protein LOC126773427 [Nymphalis io]|uniref:uncharacterized protein LOC126773427 n=1 Tax=Inachis io TaxID=171585 RepID=UPI00216954C9|nr:uncharacterized protein LOC126773427 [Nymphalis io]
MFKQRCVLHFMFLFLTINFIRSEEKNDEKDVREKRQINSLPLVYPYGGTYKLLIGFAAPVPNDDHISLVFAINFQYQYVQFTNITELSRYYFIKEVSREERDADLESRRDERLIFYKSVSNMLQMKGMNGQDCVLRAICEAAQYPVEEEALIGEILHILLTPDYGHSPFENKDLDWEEAMSLYKDAATAGRQMFNCGYIYSGCPQGQGVLDLITTLRDE